MLVNIFLHCFSRKCSIEGDVVSFLSLLWGLTECFRPKFLLISSVIEKGGTILRWNGPGPNILVISWQRMTKLTQWRHLNWKLLNCQNPGEMTRKHVLFNLSTKTFQSLIIGDDFAVHALVQNHVQIHRHGEIKAKLSCHFNIFYLNQDWEWPSNIKRQWSKMRNKVIFLQKKTLKVFKNSGTIDSKPYLPHKKASESKQATFFKPSANPLSTSKRTLFSVLKIQRPIKLQQGFQGNSPHEGL